MTLDASGNLGVGTTSPGAKLEVAGTTSNTLIWNTTTTAANGFSARNTGGQFYFGIDDSGGGYYNTGTAYGRALYSTGAYPMVFFTNATERARITSGGFFKASNSGSYVNSTANYHEIDSNQQSLPALMVYASNASYDYGDGIFMVRAARNTTNNSFYAIEYFNETAGTARFRVADSGNVTNTNNSYGAISDIKLKENITDATPKLGGLMQVRVRNYNLKSDPEHKQLGVIAQELEQVFPGMVEESPDRDADGNDLGTTTKQVKYSVFVPMLIKAMQEQQVIIEQLKADVAALKGA
jgi:hypothetical protein